MSNVNVLAELERYGLPYQFADGDEVKCKCPFHEDSSPSCFIHLQKQVFICRASHCSATGDVFDLLARHSKSTRKAVMVDLGKRYQIVDEPTIKVSVIEKYHNQIWQAEPLLRELYKRGITDNDIRKHRLGERDGRITIPIRNTAGQFVSVRSYLPGAPGADKMRNMKGRSKKLRFYPHDQLSYMRIVVTGGEMKAVAAAARLNKHGIGAVCVTGGEGVWDHALTAELVGKQIFVVMDIDQAGRAAADKICKLVFKASTTTHDVLLPLDAAKFPKGDMNDYVMTHSEDELLKLLEDSLPWEPSDLKRKKRDEEPQAVSLNRAYHAEMTGTRVKLQAIVAAVDSKSCAIAKTFSVKCTRDLDCCAVCPVFVTKEEDIWEIHPEADTILKMALQADYKQDYALKEDVGIPRECQKCRFNIVEYHNVETCLLSAKLAISDTTKEKEMLPALVIGQDVELNEQYELVGTPHPHPRDQTTHLVVSQYKTSLDALSTYRVTRQSDLVQFNPKEWTLESVTRKFEDICLCLEANVTHIYNRPDIHIMADLAYHSPLILDLGKDGLQRGWVQVLIVGDSAQGKSETVMKMKDYYGLGEKIVCKNATRAGLLGGVDQSLGNSFVTWGAIPTHDRRLVILEELKGASVDVIAQLTDMRDSGRAEIHKIKKRRTNARTRIIAISNSRSGNQMAQYPYGVTSIPELIGAAEDVRRFDACMIVEKSEVDIEVFNAEPPERANNYPADLCRELILWAWTRHSQVKFEFDAHRTIIDSTNVLVNKYTDEIPIVDRGSMRFKLARLAAAAAARTFSTDKSCEFVVVRKCHVEFIVQYLTRIYDTFAFGYDRYTHNKRAAGTLRDVDRIRAMLESNGDNKFIIEMLIENDKIRLNDVIDASGNNDGTWARQFLSMLVQRRALVNRGPFYVKTSEFVKFLREVQVVSPPSFMEPEF